MSLRVGWVLDPGQPVLAEGAVGLWVERETFPGDALGRLREVDGGWLLTPGGLEVDRYLREGLDWRTRSVATRLGEAARREGIMEALQVEASSPWAPAAALAAAETGLPLVVTVFRNPGGSLAGLGTLLKAASACACRTRPVRRMLERVFAPTCPLAVLPARSGPEAWSALYDLLG